jgi:hypothetical protein
MSAVQYDDKKTDSAPTLDRVESVSSINKQELVEGQDGITSLPLQEVERVTFTEAEGNAVRRKLDLVILPLMCMVSLFTSASSSAAARLLTRPFISLSRPLPVLRPPVHRQVGHGICRAVHVRATLLSPALKYCD